MSDPGWGQALSDFIRSLFVVICVMLGLIVILFIIVTVLLVKAFS